MLKNAATSNVTPMRTDFAPISNVNTTRSLARFIVNTKYEDLSPAALNQARRLIIDCFGVALGAAREPDLPILLDYAKTMGGEAHATIWSTGVKQNIEHVALINGQLASVFDMDDTYLSDSMATHCSAQSIPAALAIAEWRGLSGKDFITAVALSHEISLRTLLSFGKTFHRQRWYSVPVGGVFGGVTAAGKMLRLTEQQMVYALALAGLQAGGVIEGLGTMSGGFQYGRSGAGGVRAAFLGKSNFTTSEDILTGRFGMHTVFHSDQDLAWLTDGLGSHWEMLQTGFKPYACGINMHALISGIIAIHDQFKPDPAQVADITLRVNPHVLIPTGLKEPRVGREGKFSVYYTAAVALIDGKVGPAQYTDARVKDANVDGLRQRVLIDPDETKRRDEAHVTVNLRDGRKLEHYVKHAPGTIKAPLSDDDLIAKFNIFAKETLGPGQTAALLKSIDSLATLPDAGALARLMTPAA